MIARLVRWLGQWRARRNVQPQHPAPDDDIGAYI
jgi:hypothetical protein